MGEPKAPAPARAYRIILSFLRLVVWAFFRDVIVTGREHVPKAGETQVAVRRGDWKLVVTGDKPSLYDLSNDPTEGQDLAAEEATHLEELRADLETWLTALGDS